MYTEAPVTTLMQEPFLATTLAPVEPKNPSCFKLEEGGEVLDYSIPGANLLRVRVRVD